MLNMLHYVSCPSVPYKLRDSKMERGRFDVNISPGGTRNQPVVGFVNTKTLHYAVFAGSKPLLIDCLIE